MGFWSSNSSIGDILGQQIGGLLSGVWGASWEAVILAVCGLFGLTAVLFMLFVRDKPTKEMTADLHDASFYQQMQSVDSAPLEASCNGDDSKNGISFWKAWLLPG